MKFEDLDEIEAFFEANDDEYLKFERVENKLHYRPDIHAFLLISKILPEDRGDIITSSEHDEFYLEADCETLFERATEEQVIELIRCGVRFDNSLESLCMYA